MWRWFLAVCLVWVGTHAEDVSCPNHCQCFWDEDNYWAARCKAYAISPRNTGVFPSIQVLNIKPSHRTQSVKLAPKMFQRFRNIKILNLSNASIIQLPDDVFMGLRYVSDIDLSYNRIRSINGIVFKSLRELQTLLLRGNPLIINTFSTIYSDSLKELDIGECGLKTIPVETFANVNSLTHLSLDRNYLQTIYYQSVPNNLKYLNLASNKITNVPTKVLLSLSFLRRIDISDNPVNCTCSLLLMQDWLSGRGVALENDVICHSPHAYRGKNLNDINENELCNYELDIEKQMNKLRFAPPKFSHSNRGSEINALHIYDIPMADQPKPDESEVLFDNGETKALGTHMESSAYKSESAKESLEMVEGSGDDSDITTDSSENRSSKLFVVDDDKERESFEATSETFRSSSDVDNSLGTNYSGEERSASNSSVEEENSSKNQSFEIDNPSDSDSSFTEIAPETSSFGPDSQSTTQELESSGSGPLILPETSSKVEIIDEKERFSSTTEPSVDSLSEETSEPNLQSSRSTESNLETSSDHLHLVEVSSAHSELEEVPTTQGSSTESHIYGSDSVESSENPSSSTTEEPIHVEVTEPIIIRKKVVTEGLEHYSELSTEASIANETEDVVPRADTAGVAQSVTTYIIIAVIALPVIILILMAACRRKSPRKVRLPQDTESNIATELQDILLPKNGGTENGVKVVPKANGAANPADSKSPEEVAPVLQAEPEPEPEPTIIEEPPPSRQNGATTPIQKTKAKLTVIADSIPKTPVFIHKSYPD